LGFFNFAWSVDLRVICDSCTVRTDVVCVRDAEILQFMVHILNALIEVLNSLYLQF